MIGRSVEMWAGKTPDTPVPNRVKLRVFERYEGRCYLSGRKITPSDRWEVEHIIALGLGGRNSEDNLAPALADRHKIKTAEDVGLMAKADRIRAKHLGLHKSTGPKIKSRGFEKSTGRRATIKGSPHG